MLVRAAAQCVEWAGCCGYGKRRFWADIVPSTVTVKLR